MLWLSVLLPPFYLKQFVNFKIEKKIKKSLRLLKKWKNCRIFLKANPEKCIAYSIIKYDNFNNYTFYTIKSMEIMLNIK